jgi:hypothetical protein
VKWYPVAEPVECLPFPCKINSLDWSSFPELAAGVGEVYGSPRAYNGAKAIPYARGLTPCEPAEVFADGDTYDPTRPPQKYDELGLALCCRDRFVSTGGLLWGGTAIVNVVTPTALPTSCSGAELLTAPFDVVRLAPATTGGWFEFLRPLGTTHLNFVSCTDPAATIEVWIVSCPGMGGVLVHTLNVGDNYTIVTGVVGPLWCNVTAGAVANTSHITYG